MALAGAGLIEETEDRPAPESDDERRRYHRITRFGRRVAAAEARRLAVLVEIATRKKLLSGALPVQLGRGR